MRKLVHGLTLGAAVLLLGGCSGTIPVEYETQSYVQINEGAAELGEFVYEPADAGEVETNQLQNTAVGSIYIAEDVSRYVQRATALEMQSAGVEIEDGAPVRVVGRINKLELDDLGYSVDWSYSVTYTARDTRSNEQIFQKTYTPDKRTTGKFGQPSDYTSSINLIILAGIEAFLEDAKARDLFVTGGWAGETDDGEDGDAGAPVS
ncbi:hypothetical protein CKO28_04650 [Rhodovibrio sodomensis]|uniref:Lipoprotein n=1 Tax=Rhodovibrio sodomensis TaxID=1088 RepID=A0ABS1DA66_9PROT|nr:hypothetical protein [Rhodovibrio sodomensis]MBK1667317.1 hypothetical protein [Rhodovibrio sodomensis]